VHLGSRTGWCCIVGGGIILNASIYYKGRDKYNGKIILIFWEICL